MHSQEHFPYLTVESIMLERGSLVPVETHGQPQIADRSVFPCTAREEACMRELCLNSQTLDW